MKKKSSKIAFSLDKHEINYVDNYIYIEQQVRKTIEVNIKKALNSEYYHEKAGLFNEESFLKYFTLSGSLKTHSLDSLGVSRNFFQREDRFFIRKYGDTNEFILRGPRYLAALDEHLSVIQKLSIYYEDIYEGLEVLNVNYDPIKHTHFLAVAPVLDYIKNALITLYNAYTHRERIGHGEHSNKEYQELKQTLLEAVNESVICFYLSFVDQYSNDRFRNLKTFLDEVMLRKILNVVTKEFREFKFSSRAVVRPEASHPLILASFAHNIYTKYPAIKLVFGLPAGGTELACLVHKYFEYKTQYAIRLILLPLSMHTAKRDFSIRTNKIDKRYLKEVHKTKLDDESVNSILVDDNSSTGQTIEVAQKLIRKSNGSINLLCAVAEADIIRTRLKSQDKKKKNKVANPVLYTDSVGILPISKRIRPRHDLKEVMESRQLYNYYRNKKGNRSLIEEIKFEVIADSIENKYEFINSDLNLDNSILTFKHQFLSNFYFVPINYNGKVYPSVEHAYLRQKYRKEDLQNLSVHEKKELNQIFKFKGLAKELHDFSDIFYDSNIAAGTVKRISNKLKEWGYQIDDWDDKRMNIMIELLLLKFSDYEMLHLLIATGKKYLVEGNDWNDTFWGVSNERGKNFLGRIIMKIREKNILKLN